MLKILCYRSENCLKKASRRDLQPLIGKILENDEYRIEEECIADALEIVRKCVEMFIQANFTGNLLAEDVVQEFIHSKQRLEKVNVRRECVVNGEELDVNVLFPELLFLARKTLKACMCDHLVLLVWRARVICLHQQVLEDLTYSLFKEFREISEEILKHEDFSTLDIEDSALLMLEIAQGYAIFRRVKPCKELLDSVKDKLKTQLNITSLLGMRTRFQTKPLPQMILRVERKEVISLSSASETHGSILLPKLLHLDDDTRLEKIKFLNEEEAQIDNLPSVIQSLIVLELHWLQMSQPKDNLAEEEIQPYIVTLLHQDHGAWSVRIAALMANIELEAKNRRTVDRSLKQCEEILKLVRMPGAESHHRLLGFFSSGMPPIWRSEMQLGSLMMSLGLVKTALDVYRRIQAWDDVITCYNMLELRHKAEEVIRQELTKSPTAKLYCLLGDATDDPSWYEKAWEFSERRSGKAQKHWGNYFFARKEYSFSIPHFQESLEINTLQEPLWLRLGFAALETEEWKIAAHAYQMYTSLESGTFEAWNNLAKAYVKMGDKNRAQKVLAEALKCNYDVWQVWENFMVVSLDTGHFDDVLNAYNRLMELKTRYEDRQVLDILTSAIEGHVPDQKGTDSHRLAEKASKILAQLCIQHGRDGFYWEMAARVAKDSLSRAQKLLKAFTGHTQSNPKWHEVPESSEKVLKICLEMSQLSLEAANCIREDNRTLVVSQLASARLSVQSCLRNAKESVENSAEQRDELTKNLQILTDRLKEFAK
ncbi:tetratricopeptide repeat protein 27 [Phlebotomus argentipes]|uniref:tetratricopeptide repeat protein 27 n=1 Tax=Phlebotomus argentipes TaxID=94469 RepID=UPI0028931DE6|nr:tetratricopeptide repeat protein 27 [Phlebotomus argentipes]